MFELLSYKDKPLEHKPYKKNKSSNTQLSDAFFSNHPMTVWGLKSFFHNSAKYTFVIITLMLLITSVLFSYAALNSVAENFVPSSSDYFLSRVIQGYYSVFHINNDEECIKASDVQALTDTTEASMCAAYSTRRVHILDDTIDELEDSNYPYSVIGSDAVFLSVDEINIEKQKYGYSINDTLYISNLMGCNDMLFNVECYHINRVDRHPKI